jgi:transcriptional regulator with XRE-family HTH domain
MTIGQRIRNSRIEQGVSQESLAELVNVSRQTVSKWENGAAYPSGENLTELSRIFHIPMDALVKDDWVPPEEKPPEVQYGGGPRPPAQELPPVGPTGRCGFDSGCFCWRAVLPGAA